MKQHIYIITIVCLSLFACKREKRHADLTGIDFDIKIERFDSAFWTLDTMRVTDEFARLREKYPDIMDIYCKNVVRFGAADSEIAHSTYKLFRANAEVGALYEDALKIYADVSDIEETLTDAFRRTKYFLPQLATPRVYCHVSGLNQSVVVGEDFISLSVDNYLGADYELYKKIGIYKYQLPNMRREKVAVDYVTAWISSEFANSVADNLLADMIRYGKIYYTVSVLMPETDERVIMGYSEEQWQWAKENEANMWNALIASRDLYSTSMMIKNQYVGDGPFSKPFSQESPGKAGAWLGWMIVESYMRSNPQVSIQQLLQQPDAQVILNESNYRP